VLDANMRPIDPDALPLTAGAAEGDADPCAIVAGEGVARG
jgi:hypothetical protein